MEGGRFGKVAELDQRYDEIITTAKRNMNMSHPANISKTGITFTKRMAEEKERYTLFLHDPRVEPDNNLAERCAKKIQTESGPGDVLSQPEWSRLVLRRLEYHPVHQSCR